MKIDLHMHSTFSDGMNSPTKLIEIASERELTAVALTDHDTVDGIPEMMEAGERAGIEVMPGVELSSEFLGRDLHILGYGFDHTHNEFRAALHKFCDARYKRGLKIVEKLNKLGIDIEPAEVLQKAGDGVLGRPHVAQVLVEKKVVSYVGEAFDKYIAEGKPAYVPKYKMSPREAVDLIHNAGGLAFVAHPGLFFEDNADAVAELLEEGFDGVEVHHPSHTPDRARMLGKVAEDHGLLISGGSDYHGFNGKHLPMGTLDIPYKILEQMKEKLADA